MKYLQSLRTNDKFSLKLTDIGVITPYRKQVRIAFPLSFSDHLLEVFQAMIQEAIFLAMCNAMTSEKHCKLQRRCHAFPENCYVEYYFFEEISRSDWLIFYKSALQVDMPHAAICFATLQKVKDN